MVRKVHGTNGTKSPRMVRKVHQWYETSVVRIVYGTKSLATIWIRAV